MRRLLLLFVTIMLYAGVGIFLPAHATYGAGPAPTPTPEGTAPEPTAVPQHHANLSLNATVRGGGSYRVGSWLPVRVTVQNDGPDFVGDLRVSSARGSAQYGTSLDLPRNSRKSVTVYVHANRITRRLTVRVLRGGEQVLQQQIVVDPHPINERLVAILSSGQPPFRLPPTLIDGNRLVAVPLTVADFPESFAGFSSFDALVLDDLPLDELQTPQLQALREWIARGGQVIINGGQGAARTLAGLPEGLRPVTVAGVVALPAGELIPAPPDGSVALEVAQVTALPGSRPMGNLALTEGTQPLLFDRPLGKGSVTFSILRLNEPTLSVWERAAIFWSDLLNERQIVPPGFGPNDVSPEQMVESSVASALTRLPALELPSLTLLGLLLLAYVVLAGPVTFLVLRRLDRQALGWVVVPMLTVIFAAVAYGVGYARRGGDVVLNEIALIEPLGDGQARVRSFVGLFSPSREAYSIELEGEELLRPISLQGPWDTSEQGGVFGPEVASELDVPQWSMRAVMAESVRPFAGLEATVTLDDDVLRGEVVNGTEQVLRDVVLVQDVHIGKVGDLQPGERKTITFGKANERELANLRAKFGGAPLSYLIYNDLIEQMQGPRGGQPLPPIIQLRQGLLDALYATGPAQRSATPLLIAWGETLPTVADVPLQKIARQQIALITMEPALQLAQQQVALDQGWLQRMVEVNDPLQSQTICMGSKGLGMNLYGQAAVQTLTLPKPLRGLEAEELRLLPSADGPWPQDVTLELFDWRESAWVAQTLEGQKALVVAEPTRFLSPHSGQLRARMTGQPNPNGGGCVYLDATVRGRVP